MTVNRNLKQYRAFGRWWDRIVRRVFSTHCTIRQYMKPGEIWMIRRECQIALEDEIIWDKHGPDLTRRKPHGYPEEDDGGDVREAPERGCLDAYLAPAALVKELAQGNQR